jgi:hypothetical protein
MSIKYHVISVNTEGEMTDEKFGYKGSECTRAHTWTREVGTVVSDEKKPAFYERAFKAVTRATQKLR